MQRVIWPSSIPPELRVALDKFATEMHRRTAYFNVSEVATAPSHVASLGTLWVTSAGVLYINKDGSTTWEKVGAQ